MNDKPIRMASVDEMMAQGFPHEDANDVEARLRERLREGQEERVDEMMRLADAEAEAAEGVEVEVPLSLDDPAFVASLDAEIGANMRELERPNRAERRRGLRAFRRRFVRADAGIKRLHHPFLANRNSAEGQEDTPRLTVWGAKELARRRKADKVAQESRRRNRGKG